MSLDDNSRVLNFSASDGHLALTALTITGGRTTDFGGGIRTDSGTVTLTNSMVSGNKASLGGGIMTFSGTVTVTNSTVSGNSSRSGGGVFTDSGTVTLTNSTVSGNSAGDGGNSVGYYGGGITTFSGTVRLTNSTVSENSSRSGGGIWAASGDTVTLTNSTVSGNSSGRYGGGIRAVAGTVTLTNSTVSGNSARFFGGGIWTRYATVTLTNTTVSGNRSESRGGGIQTFSGTVTLTNTTVSGNSAGYLGGGIRNYYGTVTLTNSTISGNSAADGGGISVDNGKANPDLTLENSIVAGNLATGLGPDLLPDPDSTLTINHSLIGVADGLTITGVGNLTGSAAMPLDPLLAPLADNGGPTPTHALREDSPALNAGNPFARPGVDGVPEFDQRGAPFGRVANDIGNGTPRIDIGAFELQPLSCDFDGDDACELADIDALIGAIAAGTNDPLYDLTGDALVDLADRDAWLADAGALNLPSGNSFLVGDANLDGRVDGQDFIAWNQNKFTLTRTWSQGDFNADGQTDGQDFVIWNMFKFQASDDESESRPAGTGPRSVPVPFREFTSRDR